MHSSLQSLEPILYDLTRGLPFGVIITDGSARDPKVVHVNDLFCKQTGYSKDEFLGKNPKMLQGEKTNRETIDHLRYCLEKLEFYVGETYNYTKGGKPFYLQWCISHFYYEEECYYFAIQKYYPTEATDVRVINYDELCSLTTQWNQTLKSQLQNMINFTHIETADLGEVGEQLAKDVRLRLLFLGSIAKLFNYVIANIRQR